MDGGNPPPDGWRVSRKNYGVGGVGSAGWRVPGKRGRRSS